jgi:tRNA(Ile)-lysidine synthase
MKAPEAPVLDRVAGSISRYNMLQSGHRVGVAVSGGADSVCLLHVLHSLAGRFGIALTVLHLNHKLRGADSDADADFVRDLAGRLALPFVLEEIHVAGIEGNLEQSGRNARRAFFHRLIESGCLDRVATGHTRSDQAETVLYRLLRGSGTAGIAGIVPVVDGSIIRPFLDCDRTEVKEFLRERSIVWREDRTNADLQFARNRIRHELIPTLERDFNPGIARVFAGMAEVARDEEEYWEREITELLPRHGHASGEAFVMRIGKEWESLHRAVQRRVLRRVLSQEKGDLRGIGAAHIEQILELADKATGDGRLQIPGVDVWRSFDWVRFAKAGTPADADFETPVTPPGPIITPGGQVLFVDVIDFSSPVTLDSSYNRLCLLDVDRLSGPLVLRNWRPGDRYTPRGSHEKIKHLFQRCRIPVWERRGWPVMVSGAKIVWAKEFGPAADVLPSTCTRRVLRIRDDEAGDSREPYL